MLARTSILFHTDITGVAVAYGGAHTTIVSPCHRTAYSEETAAGADGAYEPYVLHTISLFVRPYDKLHSTCQFIMSRPRASANADRFVTHAHKLADCLRTLPKFVYGRHSRVILLYYDLDSAVVVWVHIKSYTRISYVARSPCDDIMICF